MRISRREWLLLAAGAGIAHAAAPGKIRISGMRIGVTDWNLELTGKVEALEFAKKLGFEGVEVSIGRAPINGKLPLDNPELQAQYLAAVRKHKIEIASLCLDILHVNSLRTDPLGRKWLGEAIPIAQKLKAPSILLPVFGKNAPKGPAELDQFADLLKEYAPAAEKAKVVLALEDTISAEDNARIIDRSRSKAVKVFYDVANVLSAGLDPVKEIRWLGKDRIGAIHLKDRGYLGSSGKLDFAAIMQAIADIKYKGWADLETSNPSKNVEADMKRNLAYIRNLIQ